MDRLDYSRMKDAAAIQFMILDMLGSILGLSETPAKMGVYLTQQIRQLVGARIVLLVQYAPRESRPGFRMIAIEPERYRTSAKVAGLASLVPVLRNLREGAIWFGDQIPGFAAMGCDSLIVIPLSMGAEPVGALLAMDLLEMNRNEDVLRAMEILGPFVGLVLRNAFYYENLEAEIQLRTRELAESAKLFRNLAEAAPVGIFHLDPEGRLVFVNGQWRQITGVPWLIGPPQAFHLLIHPEDRADAGRLWQEAQASRNDFNSEFRLLRPDGSSVWVLGRAVFEFDEQDQPLGVIGTLTDITRRKEAEAEKADLQIQLMQSQKMESLGSLAGGVAHDMNNVLGAILGLASANMAALPAGSPTHKAFETISQAAVRGGKMVNSLLSFARRSPAEERVLAFNAILQEVADLLERTTLARIRLELELAPDLRPISGDAGALNHAVMNLCVNAMDAMPDNGTLTLRTRNAEPGWIEATVVDTGTGMSREVLKKALDPFYTTKEVGKGTGLGLSMAYSTVQAHHGTMEISSEPGRGTCIKMRFPACPPVARPAVPAMEVRVAAQPQVLSVLVVDDDEFIRGTSLILLEMLGHIGKGVVSGEEALAELAAGLRADVIILDMNMPGLGGAGTLPRLLELDPTVHILIATGKVDAAVTDLAGSLPRVSLLPKPYSLRELQAHLEPLGPG